jgi:hypothetical protein
MQTLFEPKIRLKKDGLGNLILQATTPTPNSCYVAGETEILPPLPPFNPDPAGDAVSPLPGPRVLGVKLLIEETDSDICLPFIRPVHHCVKLSPPSHTIDIQVTVVRNGETLKEKIFALNSFDEVPEEPNPIIDIEDFRAWLNTMPSGQTTLHVQGNVTLPDPGYQVKLVQAENAKQCDTLVLHLNVKRLDGFFPAVVTTRSVEYEQIGDDLEQFNQVKIMLAGDRSIHLKVHRVISDPPNPDHPPVCRPKAEDDIEEFTAFLDLMPGDDPTLRVEGMVQVPHPGHTLSLMCVVPEENAEPSNTLVLELRQTSLDGFFPSVISLCPVKYVTSGAILRCFRPEKVKILRSEQEPIEIPIQIVH